TILKSLLYFDLFRYPLTLPEIIRFASIQIHHLHIAEEALQQLEDNLMVYRFGEFWSLNSDYANIERRQKGNRSAIKIWDKAIKRSKFIQRFPFVRSVNISGSLSKNYFDADADFDFFIITSPNRLWLCRMLLTLYKKFFLFNSRKYFCINYFIDTESLEIPDKNIFTAIEIATLKNMTGENFYNNFMEHNNWVYKYFPNCSLENSILSRSEKHTMAMRISEKLLDNKMGDLLDTICFKLILRFWKRKFKHLSRIEFENNLRSRKHVSKHHPQGFQFKVLEGYKKRIHTFEQQHHVTLSNG
ncbi:MAG TPA: hypothetical protein VFM99_09550, partial [Chitinophagales bacterium]|nr:hypothetical protein [Chitinophagales bacterium]